MRIGAYRFFSYASDRDEPAHIHVGPEDSVAKLWLDPVRLQSSGGFARVEISRMRLVKKHQLTPSKAWNEYFRD